MLGLRLSAALASAPAARAAARASRVPSPRCFVAVARSAVPKPAERRALATAASAGSSGAAAAPAAGNATESLADAYTRLAGVKPYLVSTQQPVELTGLWGADERAVVFFARHMVRACSAGQAALRGPHASAAATASSTRPPPTCTHLHPPAPPRADCSAGSWPSVSSETCGRLSTQPE